MNSRPWLPYVLPMAAYMAFLGIQSDANLVWVYPLKAFTVAGILWWFRREYTELTPRTGTILGILVGLVAIVQWIALDPFYPKLTELMFSVELKLSEWMNSPPPKANPAPAFDPTGQYLFIAVRIFGACVVVPLMEELFWRGFLIRWIEREDFRAEPVGRFTWKSFAITTVFFGLEHNQWLVGLICGALYNGLLYRTRSLWACVVAHAVSNAALAAWVLARNDWKFW
jgi:hypothetical protein